MSLTILQFIKTILAKYSKEFELLLFSIQFSYIFSCGVYLYINLDQDTIVLYLVFIGMYLCILVILYEIIYEFLPFIIFDVLPFIIYDLLPFFVYEILPFIFESLLFLYALCLLFLLIIIFEVLPFLINEVLPFIIFEGLPYVLSEGLPLILGFLSVILTNLGIYIKNDILPFLINKIYLILSFIMQIILDLSIILFIIPFYIDCLLGIAEYLPLMLCLIRFNFWAVEVDYGWFFNIPYNCVVYYTLLTYWSILFTLHWFLWYYKNVILPDCYDRYFQHYLNFLAIYGVYVYYYPDPNDLSVDFWIDGYFMQYIWNYLFVERFFLKDRPISFKAKSLVLGSLEKDYISDFFTSKEFSCFIIYSYRKYCRIKNFLRFLKFSILLEQEKKS